jgi:hypothetical protein
MNAAAIVGRQASHAAGAYSPLRRASRTAAAAKRQQHDPDSGAFLAERGDRRHAPKRGVDVETGEVPEVAAADADPRGHPA